MREKTVELSESGSGAGRRIEPAEADLAAAVFLFVHRACGEAAQIYPEQGSLLCRCEACGVSRLYTYAAPPDS